jgi:aryl-alcohol dehydrogenase-like predicted oxidoreductase
MTLERIALGDGLESPVQGFGGMALADVYGAAEESESIATINHAIDVGASLIDTANVYGAGRNEELIANVLADRRDEIVLATKFGILPAPDVEGLRARGDAAYVHESIDASLRRLGVEIVDLYYYHRVDPRVAIEETVGALAELVAAGKVRHIGLSEVTGRELERAHAVHPIAAVQSEWSIFSRDVEDHVAPTAARLGVGFVAYSPLGRGLLAAPAPDVIPEGDLRRNFPRFADENLAANQAVASAVRRVAHAEGRTPAQVALAWVYERARSIGVAVVPIPSTRRAARIDENVAAADIRLSSESLAELDALAAQVVGERAPDIRTISRGRELG